MTLFSRIYRDNVWQGTETRSGPGSGMAATRRVARVLVELCAMLGVHSVVDAACGEGWWQPTLPGYLGLDVAPEAIAAARRNWPDRSYLVHDVRVSCPTADLVLLRDMLQHVTVADGLAAIASVRASGSRWLLASTYSGGDNAVGRPVGRYHYHEPNLERAPYGLPPATLLVRDGYGYTDPDQLRDPRKMLGLWRVSELG